MTSRDDLAQVANQHWFDAYKTFVGALGGEFRRFGTVAAFVGGIPLPFANGSLVLWQAAPRDLDAAVRWVKAARVPFEVKIEESLAAPLADLLAEADLVADPVLMPGMVMRPVAPRPAPAPRVTVERVDHGNHHEFVAVLVATGLPEVWAGRTFPLHLAMRPDVCFFMARLDGRPVGTALALRTDSVGGIYSVATVEAARGRGVGTTVTWAAVDQIRRWGCSAAVLQSSAMGHSVYRKMGFGDTVAYARFTPPSGPPQSAPSTPARERPTGRPSPSRAAGCARRARPESR